MIVIRWSVFELHFRLFFFSFNFLFWMGFRTSNQCPSTLDRSMTVVVVLNGKKMNHRFTLSLALLIQSHTNFVVVVFLFSSQNERIILKHSSTVNTHQNPFNTRSICTEFSQYLPFGWLVGWLCISFPPKNKKYQQSEFVGNNFFGCFGRSRCLWIWYLVLIAVLFPHVYTRKH